MMNMCASGGHKNSEMQLLNPISEMLLFQAVSEDDRHN